MSYSADEILPEEPAGEVVHWMEPGPLRLGARDVPVAPLVAFALGVAAAIGAVLLYHYLEPRREALPPWRWRRGTTH
jgi:hypothetical protein